MPQIELSDYTFLAIPILVLVAVLIALKVAYRAKSFVPLPTAKPGFVWLPKYTVSLPMQTGDHEAELAARLGSHGFSQRRLRDHRIEFTRGSALGDFSIKIAKVVATTSLPASNPAQLKVEYGVLFGCAFDTGDLWQFCRELTDKIEAAIAEDLPPRVETGNPYQPPRTM